MAIEKPFILPQGQQLTSEIATNLYLYAQETTPTGEALLNSELIRPTFDTSNIPDNAETFVEIPQNIELINAYVDAEPYMASGPGRFANGSQFDLVRAFFGLGRSEMLTPKGEALLIENKVLLPGTYSKEQINDELFVGGGLANFSSGIELRNYRDQVNDNNGDGKNDDYDELVYLWNSSNFALPDNVEFVVEEITKPDGTKDTKRYIRNFRIQPNAFPDIKSKENFDFATANPIIETISKSTLEPRVDPSLIGRTVHIDFYNRGNLPLYDPANAIVSSASGAGVYDINDFNQDLVTEALRFEGDILGFGPAALREADKLFNAGVTKFLYQNKPILYGTVNNDILLTAAYVSSTGTPTLNPFKNNGVVLIGGTGNDNIIGASKEDILLGGEGLDTLNGNGGDDTAIFSDDFENYAYSISEDKKTITFAHVISPQTDDGVDTLKNIEWGQFKDRTVPLPLEDGVLETKSVKATDTTASPNPNDPPTPPHVSLTMPVEMLDGNVDYTLNISPYKPDTQYNILYFLDTSSTNSASSGFNLIKFEQAKDAYIDLTNDLTNYFVNNGLAENINFGIVTFNNNATLQTDSN